MTDGDEDPEPSEDAPDAGNDETTTRRRVLLGGASLGVVGAGRALYNTVLGYGQFGMGTNLEEQDVASVAEEHLWPNYDESIDGNRVRVGDDAITIDGEASVAFGADARPDAADLDSRFGLDGRLEALQADVSALRSSSHGFEFHSPSAFFHRLEEGRPRPDIVTAIRTHRDRVVDPETVSRFTGVDPADPTALVDGLTAGFREHTSYDIPRYLAGSVEDNVIFGATDLREHFEDGVSFEALLDADETGIFCWELVYRSIEALQALPADRQSVPIAACYVTDNRHKHAYTGLLGAIREGDGLRLPMTFVDYTYSTLYDDLGLRGVLGEGVDAYGDGHRADGIYW